MNYCVRQEEVEIDTTRWKDGDGFPLLDLIAEFRFKSASTVSFELGYSDRPDRPGEGRLVSIIGWLDAHHPCDGVHRLQLRIGLPDRYASWESMRDLVPQVKAALELPPDETFHVSLVGLSKWTSMEEPQSGIV